MPIYEYECKKCEKIFEVQQKISDDPLSQCPDCGSGVEKLISQSSFHLKGGGWYADGYGSGKDKKKSEDKSAKAGKQTTSPCKAGGDGKSGGCGNCPASSSSS